MPLAHGFIILKNILCKQYLNCYVLSYSERNLRFHPFENLTQLIPVP